MARTKQATPVRRTPSSEYSGKHDRILQRKDPGAANGLPEKVNGAANGQAAGQSKTSHGDKPAVAKKDAGIVTLITDVAGIYASL